MRLELWCIGKTTPAWLVQGVEDYAKRLPHYLPFQLQILPDVKNAGKMAATQLKAKEAELVLGQLKPQDGLFLLDEQGMELGSVQLAQWMERQLQMPYNRLVWLVGGAFGFDEALYVRAQGKIALSKMTFSHQMVRLIALEQLYRAMTILRNEPYHNA